MQSKKLLIKAVDACFGSEWLKFPTEEELWTIEEWFKLLGFPGCIGVVESAAWKCNNCPVGWKFLYKEKEKKPVLRMKVLCDENLHIYNLNFRTPGSKNDKKIFDHSPLFNKIWTSQWLPFHPDLCLSGYRLKWIYILVDGIYPMF